MHRSSYKQKQRRPNKTHKKTTCQTNKKVKIDDHPSVPVMDNYIFYRERLSQKTIEKVEAHIAVCKRCRSDVEYGMKHADYFRRLMKAPIDC